jgi:hypothetical protein
MDQTRIRTSIIANDAVEATEIKNQNQNNTRFI